MPKIKYKSGGKPKSKRKVVSKAPSKVQKLDDAIYPLNKVDRLARASESRQHKGAKGATTAKAAAKKSAKTVATRTRAKNKNTRQPRHFSYDVETGTRTTLTPRGKSTSTPAYQMKKKK